MAKTEKDKSDGLEIISAGLLYNGPWDKKYWSSSRGKDRYPYPVGYHAARTHNGITYKMEILEDHKGPLFRITSTDGQSCSGQTPDIAWDNFQKMGNTRIKFWRGKRFSCKIDGVEFFGFKNQFVLRLLRELVTNVNGTASSNSSGGVPETKFQTCCTEPGRQPDLLPYLEKPTVTGKRSRIRGVSSVKSTSSDTQKRIRPQDQRQSNDVSPPKLRSQKRNFHNDKNSASLSPSLDNNYGISNNSGIVEVSAASKIVEEEKSCLNSVESSDQFIEEVLQEDDRVLMFSPNHAAIISATFKDNKPFDRSNDICAEWLKSSEVKKEGKTSFQNASQTINDLELCAPDSLDLLDGTLNPKDVNNELTGTCLFTSEDSVTDSHMEEDVVTSAAHMNPEKNHTEVNRQEITRSMMTVLLPRAVPLLKTFTRKKKKKYTNKKNKINVSVDVASPVTSLTENAVGIKHQEETHMLSTDLHSLDSICGDTASMVPDSFDNNQSDKDADNHCLMVPDAAEANLITFGQDTCIPKTSGLPVLVHVLEDPAVVSDITFPVCHEEHETLSKRLQRGNGIVSNSDKLVPLESFVKETDAQRADGETVKTSFTEMLDTSNLTRQCDIPLSESILCRSFRDMCDPETYAAGKVTASDNYQLNLGHILSKEDCKYEEKLDGQFSSIHQEKSFVTTKAPICHVSTSQCQIFDSSASREGKSQDCGNLELPRHQDLLELDVPVPPLLDQEENFRSKIDENKIKRSGSYLAAQKNMKYNSNPADIFELMGCYFHPMPISLVLLSTQADSIYICVLCCSFVDKKRTVFIYRTEIEGERKGYPSFIGHASIAFPVIRDASGREMALDGSCLQFTPDGQYLVLLNCIKAPCCKEGNISCPCPECKSASFEKNAVKIVQVKPGYMSVVATMKTADSIHCILVCEPNYLLAAGGSTRLHLWVMNSTWSAVINESYLPSSDCTAPYIVELKKIPRCSNFVLGHNGFGGFGLWDIAKCVLLSRFSAPSTSFCRFSPISLFTLQRKGIAAGSGAMEQISNIMNITTKLFMESANTHMCPVEGKDVAIPFLISNSDLHSHESSNFQVNTDGWRQALLVNNTMLLEDILDLRAVTVGTLAGHGIIGTYDGHVYIWELSTGNILGNLHQFKGSAVTCIATDDSSSSVFAVAADCGLRLYLHSQQSCSNQQGNK